MERKQFGYFEVKSETKGTVAAVVATLNRVDHDRDVILPGAVADGTQVKLSAYGHDAIYGAAPVGLGTLHVSGDEVHLDGRFFLNTERGRESFETVKALGPSGQWSIGFRVTRTANMTDHWRSKGAERLLAELAVFETSPVLEGASLDTRTLAVKGLTPTDVGELARIYARVQERQRLLDDDEVARIGEQVRGWQRDRDTDVMSEASALLAKSRDILEQHTLRTIARNARDPRFKGADMPRELYRMFAWATRRLGLDSKSLPDVRLVRRDDLPERTAGRFHHAHNAIEVCDGMSHADKEKTLLHEIIHAAAPSLTEDEVIAKERALYAEYCLTLSTH